MKALAEIRPAAGLVSPSFDVGGSGICGKCGSDGDPGRLYRWRDRTEDPPIWICLDCHPHRAYLVRCRRCNGTGFISGGGPCSCVKRKLYRSKVRAIPPRYRFVKLARIQPMPDLYRHQETVIEQLRAEPDASWVLAGAHGTGKTHLAWALYKQALRQGRGVFASRVSDLLDDYRQAKLNPDTHKPAFEPSSLLHGKWTVYLSEIEKTKPTEFGCEMLFDLLDTAYEFHQQVIVTTNLRGEQLLDHWSRVDYVWGASIVRRLEEATWVEMF